MIDPDKHIRAAAFVAIEKISRQWGRTSSLGRNQDRFPGRRRTCAVRQFRGLAPTIYQPIFPVWVKGHKQEEGHVLLATADFEIPKIDSANTARDSIEASYSRRMTRIRNHQAWFSTRTKAAYQWRCAFSGLPVRELLVGAHIVPDAEGGPPWVQNGICMSALHHVAFDSHLIGVDPNFQVHVSPQLHDQEDGDLLVTLKDLDGKSLQLPREQEDWPDREFLEHRFVRFRNSSP